MTTDETVSLILPALFTLLERAGAAIMAIYRDGASGARLKADGSPVTLADHASNRLIQQGLAELTPHWPVVSEEGGIDEAPARIEPLRSGRRGTGEVFWLLDPLDGTREFLARNDEFAISLALVVDGQPRFGMLYGPALNEWYWGGVGFGAHFRIADETGVARCRPLPAAEPLILKSRSHGDRRLDQWLMACQGRGLEPAAKPLGSALKWGRIAAGLADAYPRFGTTMAWDTAAGQALLEAAGGACFTPRGGALRWGEGWRNGDFVALADPARWQWLWSEVNAGVER